MADIKNAVARAAHPWHIAHARHHVAGMRVVTLRVVVDLLRGVADAVGPVIEHHDPLGVVGSGLVRIVDDHRQIQPVVSIEPSVWVCPVGAGMGEPEPIGEVSPGVSC
jgi:hypothetical protein